MLDDRALIRLAGDGVRDFLQGLVTQDVLTLDAAAPRWSGMLTPQGKALFDFLLWADGESVLIDCEAAEADALMRRLTMYRLRRPIAIGAAGRSAFARMSWISTFSAWVSQMGLSYVSAIFPFSSFESVE